MKKAVSSDSIMMRQLFSVFLISLRFNSASSRIILRLVHIF